MTEPQLRAPTAPAVPPSPGAQYEPDPSAVEADALEDNRWRAEMQVHGQPLDPYVGLLLSEATAVASSEGRFLEDVTGAFAVTADFCPSRIRVRLGADGRIATAEAG